MSHVAKPKFRIVALLVAALLLIGCTGVPTTGGDGEAGSEMEGNAVRIALVHTQAAGDNGPIDGMIDGLNRASETMGAEIQTVEALDPATFETTLRNLAQAETDIIISTFFAMGDATSVVAPDFPDTNFIVIVAAPIDPPQPNVAVVDYGFYEGAYVGGVYAGLMTESNQLGYTGGVPLPFAWADFNAFTDGAQSVNPDVETTAVFIESFEDPVKGRELAAGLYSSGVDFIFTGAAASDIGVVEAATDNDALVMVSSTPLVEQSPANVGIVVSIEWADTIVKEIEAAMSDDFGGTFRRATVGTEEIKFDVPEEFLSATDADTKAKAEATISQIDEIVANIMSGDLVVEEVSEER